MSAARKPDDWMPLHIGAYHADTVHLTRDQHGAYFLLLMAYWRKGGPLKADDARLAAIVKATPAEWRRLKPVMSEFFVEEDGHWTQKRAERELVRAKALTEAKAEAGRKGAEKRWQTDGTAMAQPSRSHRQTDAPNLTKPNQRNTARAQPLATDVAAALCAEWEGEAARLVAEIGEHPFKAWFSGALFDAGPPVRIAAVEFKRLHIERKFAGALRKVFGEVELRTAA